MPISKRTTPNGRAYSSDEGDVKAWAEALAEHRSIQDDFVSCHKLLVDPAAVRQIFLDGLQADSDRALYLLTLYRKRYPTVFPKRWRGLAGDAELIAQCGAITLCEVLFDLDLAYWLYERYPSVWRKPSGLQLGTILTALSDAITSGTWEKFVTGVTTDEHGETEARVQLLPAEEVKQLMYPRLTSAQYAELAAAINHFKAESPDGVKMPEGWHEWLKRQSWGHAFDIRITGMGAMAPMLLYIGANTTEDSFVSDMRQAFRRVIAPALLQYGCYAVTTTRGRKVEYAEHVRLYQLWLDFTTAQDSSLCEATLKAEFVRRARRVKQEPRLDTSKVWPAPPSATAIRETLDRACAWLSPDPTSPTLSKRLSDMVMAFDGAATNRA
jgi:hypothetical protein